MAEILIVDDELAVRDALQALLEGEGFGIRTAKDGEEALVRIARHRPDLVLLDVMMPKMNGFRCCEEIRRQDGLLPVVFLTAKDGEADEVRANGVGGDGFVSKTAGEALLLASIRRALERADQVGRRLEEGTQAVIRLGTVVADVRSLTVSEDGREVGRLTKSEADVLSCLYARRGELVVIDDIITYLRGNGFACEDSMVYSHVSRLRRKLGKAGGLIETVRRIGYCLAK